MKLSTLAIGALISISINANAQQNSKSAINAKNIKIVKTKQTKCAQIKASKTLTKTVLVNKADHIKAHQCLACGRG